MTWRGRSTTTTFLTGDVMWFVCVWARDGNERLYMAVMEGEGGLVARVARTGMGGGRSVAGVGVKGDWGCVW